MEAPALIMQYLKDDESLRSMGNYLPLYLLGINKQLPWDRIALLLFAHTD